MIIGSNTIIRMVKIMEIDTAIDKSLFFALAAAPVAIAALVPHTLVALASVITSG